MIDWLIDGLMDWLIDGLIDWLNLIWLILFLELLYAPDLKGRFLDSLVNTHRPGSKLFSTVQ